MSDNHHHILPLRVYMGVGAMLLFLTFVTVWVAQFHLGEFNLIVAMLVATIKASLVVLFFMHLLYDNKIYLMVFLLSILMLGTFITFTMLDTMRRGEIDAVTEKPINPNAAMYDSLKALPHDSTAGGHSEKSEGH